jgi:glycerophosphoryl diester phosphodiesterase
VDQDQPQRRARGFRAYAHRGGSLDAPENSLSAFTRAWNLGYVYLETDVRPTRDGVAVLHHDATLDRTTDTQGLVRSRNWSQVRQARHADGTALLRLEDLLEELPDAHITIDAKEAGSVPVIVDAIRRTNTADRICVASFSARRLTRARRLLPPGTESSAHPWETLALRLLHPPPALPRVHRVQVPERALGLNFTAATFLERAHARGLAVDVWTVNDPERMGALVELGVDGIMTDALDALRGVLLDRGLWPSVR